MQAQVEGAAAESSRVCSPQVQLRLRQMLKSYATSERQRRATDETDANARRSRDKGRAEGRDAVEQRRGADQRREPTQRRGRDRDDAKAKNRQCNKREMREPHFAGEARSFIGSAQQQLSARGDCSHAHTRRDAHIASLTPLTGAARAQLREARVRAQHRLRGALEACGALITRHLTMGAYTM